ncbi:MAG TPA: glycosyltransferase N-terminal domain-containing protein [Chitinophagaceae bacterium]|nr:glycosyltransferase N-terminal domain-containing protein [Chitinophagaceae bacterium]
MKIFYNIFIAVYPFIAKIISTKNTKAKLWLTGRKNIFTKLKEAFANNKSEVIWMHCSSLGEFEQGRPVLEKIKQTYPSYTILLTFFSPSGYEIQKNYAYANWVYYLPLDSAKNATQFLDIVQPKLTLFIKYEFWYYYLTEIKKRNIPLLLLSASFRKNQPFFKWYGKIYREMLQCFSYFFVQDNNCAELLHKIGFTKNVSIAGDTRFDRVIEIANSFESIEIIEKFIGTDKVIVAGSTWTDDDEALDHYANTNTHIKFIIAPHQIETERVNECLKLYKKAILFSVLVNEPNSNFTEKNVLIIDNIGMLSKLYKYATICFVGGAFGDDGVHNVLEAAVYKKPVVFGPEFEKYIEAKELVENNGGISIENALELEQVFNKLLTDNLFYETTAINAENYVQNNSGATKIIVDFIYAKRLLTN